MSFILDALRKSEHARQRTTGPGLAEVPVAAQKTRTNRWATALVVLLVVNLVAVGVLLLRRAARDTESSAQASSAQASSPQASPAQERPAAAATALAARTESPAVTGAPPAPTANPVLAPEPALPVARGDAASSGGRNPLADELGAAGSSGPDTGFLGPDPSASGNAARAAAAAVPDGPPVVRRQQTPPRRGSVVYAPVPEAGDLPYTPAPDSQGRAAASAPPASAPPAAASTAGVAALPTADEMVARGVPELHLDLHVYSNVPAQRFVFVNSRKYREGDTLAEGPVVEKITQDGAVLSFRGSRFRLSSD